MPIVRYSVVVTDKTPRSRTRTAATTRGYNQYCGLATGLDAVGSRWSILIVRELLIGPARFGRLQEALPGIGPNLLSERLRDLEACGVVEQRPVSELGRRRMYALTAFGEQLRPAILELARWGLKLVAEVPGPLDAVRGQWAMLAVEAVARGSRLGDDVNETYQFRVHDDVFHVVVDCGRAHVEAGEALDHDLEVVADASTFVQIGAGHLDPFEALNEGRIKIVGELQVALRCCVLLGIAPASASEVA